MFKSLLKKQKNPEKTAVIERGRCLSYADLLKKAYAVTLCIPRERRQSVAILLPDGGDFICALFGAVMSGRAVLPLNVLLTAGEIFKLLEQAAVGVVVTSTAYCDKFSKVGGLDLKIEFIDKIPPAPLDCQPKICASGKDEPMILLGTSGTTGKSKIVQLSQRNIETAAFGYLDKVRYDKNRLGEIRYILAAPFTSAYGIMIIAACFLRSFPIIVLEGAFTLDNLFQATEKYKATHCEGSATTVLLMEQMAGRLIPYDISTLKYFGFGGSKISGQSINRVLSAYPGVGLYQGYGMTEAAPLITKHPQKKLKKADSVGRAIKGVELAVDTGCKVTRTPFVSGEIVVRGPNVMIGYLGNREQTERVLKGGYLHTGDTGYLDDEGYLYILGRKKNIIIVRGYNVYPEEVEECIAGSGLARDCYVYGQADSSGNEAVCADIAAVRPSVTEEEIREYLALHLAGYKLPRRICFVEAIAKNISGKTQRR